MKNVDPRAVMALLEGDGRDDVNVLAGWLDGTVAGSRDLERAGDALRHARAASAALTSGRTQELIRETQGAIDAAPATLPPLVFLAGSLLQACFRFTGEGRLRRLALDVLGRVADRVDLPRLAIPARGLMANIHMMRGDLHRAMALSDAALALAEATGMDEDPAPAMAWQFRGYILLEWNELDAAEEALQRAWDLSEGSRGVRSGVARVLARIRGIRGDDEGASLWMARLEDLVTEPLTLRNREWLTAIQAGRTLEEAPLREVEGWLRSHGYTPADAAAWEDAWVLARLQELDQVMHLLEATSQWTSLLAVARRVASCAREDRVGFAVRAVSAEAVALEALGRTEEAAAALEDALTLGTSGAFVRTFLEGSPVRLRLLERAARRRALSEETCRVPDASPNAEAARVLLASHDPAAAGRIALTPTQTEVLRRVGTGASNKAVARDMGISLTTVKTHLRAVFQRLGVSSRTHAVARGRELGLL